MSLVRTQPSRDFKALVADAPILTDGAWGTELQRRGLRAVGCPDEWNVTHPDSVREVALSYVNAGSQVILTNTFRSNAISLAPFGLADRVREINKAGAEISREAAQDRALVFGSMGPAGAMAYEVFAEQASVLAEAGVDAILIETMTNPDEARIALKAARTTGLPVLVSFAFVSTAGVTPEQAAAAMTEGGASAVGANCCDVSVAMCRRLRSATDLPLWIKPHAGLPRITAEGLIYKVTPDEFAAQLPALVDAGATFIGACCGSTPAFIRAAVKALHTHGTQFVTDSTGLWPFDCHNGCDGSGTD